MIRGIGSEWETMRGRQKPDATICDAGIFSQAASLRLREGVTLSAMRLWHQSTDKNINQFSVSVSWVRPALCVTALLAPICWIEWSGFVDRRFAPQNKHHI